MRYKFEIGERVGIIGISDSGTVTSRKFNPLRILQMGFVPLRDYTVELTGDFFGKDLVYCKLRANESDLERKGFDNDGGDDSDDSPSPVTENPQDRYTAYYRKSVRRNNRTLVDSS